MESGHCVYSQIWRNVWRNDFVLFVSLHCEAFEPQFYFWRYDFVPFVPFVPLYCEAFEPEIDDFLDGALRSRHLDALEF